jgi:hypothetical protein
LFVVVFLICAPVVSIAAIGAAGRITAVWPHATHSWRQVPAVVQKTASAPSDSELYGYSWVLARWTAPDGRARSGEIPVGIGVTVGQTVGVWVDAAGTLVDPPPSRGVVLADQATAVAVAVAVLGIVLFGLACAGRWALDRRRLAAWEAEWADVGPRWTRRFWSRG